jgi:hypothetical protein
MSQSFPASAHQRTNQAIFFHSCLVVAILFSALILEGCGGIAASQSAGNQKPQSLTLSATLPAATVGSAYSGVVNVSGGTAPYAFSLASGQLPTGVTLGADSGAISGTPSENGSFNFAISVSDSKGLSQQGAMEISVAPKQQQGKTFSSLQSSTGWNQAGQGPPDFQDCNPCGPQITFSMEQGIGSPSMSGSATQFNIGGTGPYWDVLFFNHLIGPYSSQGMPDSNHTIVPTLHNFTYDAYFYGTNLNLSQALEFDINQFFDNLGFIWGTQCRIAGGNGWDIWDNVNSRWIHTGIPCYPNSNAWNHVAIQVQRTSDNKLWYQTITLNGVTNNINQYYDPGSAPGWYGVTVNYQMDGNSKQAAYSTYLDNFSLTYE